MLSKENGWEFDLMNSELSNDIKEYTQSTSDQGSPLASGSQVMENLASMATTNSDIPSSDSEPEKPFRTVIRGKLTND